MNKPSLQHSFKGKKVLVTGGGRGVGLALVTRLYNDEALLFVLEKDPGLVEDVRKKFPDASRLRVEVCDITKWKETQDLIESFGPLDHLINCAAICLIEDFMNVTEQQVDDLMGVNLKATFCTTQAVAKGMISAGIKGTIVNICSIWGHVAGHGSTVYTATKGGSIALTKALAVDLGKHGIRVNSFSPTAIDSPMFHGTSDKHSSDKDPTWFMNRQPLAGRKLLDVEEVVNGVLYLLSPLSGLATGSDLLMDCGTLSL